MPTIECEACRATNTLDSRFCRQCGSPLPEGAVDAARSEIIALVGDGRRLLADGRVGEALMIAESALEFDHDLVEGLALYGDCRERQERFVEAAESYERILELRPDSPLDRIRLGHLRKLAQQKEMQVAEPRQRRQFLFLTGAVTVVLVSVGLALSLSSNTKTENGKADLVASNDTGVSVFDVVPPVPNQAGPDARKSDPTTTPTSTDTPINHIDRLNEPAFQAFSGASRLLPREGVSPVIIDPSLVPTQGNVKNTSDTSNPPDVAGNRADTGGASDPVPPKKDPQGIVEISASRSASSAAGNQQENGEIAIHNLIRVARDLYIQGKYDRSADAYEKALKLGAEKGSTNQRLAQCYEKLKRNEDAIAAYRRAIAGFEDQLKKGPDQRAERALAACKKALSILGG